MAMIDFSNAIISLPSNNSMGLSYLGLQGNFCTDSSGNPIANVTITTVKNEAKLAEFNYVGTFTASGTEFYLGQSDQTRRWKISGISFQSGDTFSFNIPLKLTCL